MRGPIVAKKSIMGPIRQIIYEVPCDDARKAKAALEMGEGTWLEGKTPHASAKQLAAAQERERMIDDIARSEIKVILENNGFRLPRNDDDVLTFVDGTRTMPQMVKNHLAKHRERIEEEADKRLAER